MTLGHEHIWLKTGERHPTNPPIWFYVCECGSVGEAKKGQVVHRIKAVKRDEEFYRYYWLPAMRRLEIKK